MRKLTILIILLIATAFLIMPAKRVEASRKPGHYIVRYDCIIGPQQPDNIVGEWDVDCNHNMTGWGWEIGHNCTYTQAVDIDPCF